MFYRYVCFVVCLFVAVPRPVHADVVLDWNDTFRQVIKSNVPKANPGWSTRALAMANAAIYDVFQAIDRTNTPYKVDMLVPDASLEAAVAHTAYTVMMDCYGEQQSILDAAYTDRLANVPDGAAKTAGIALGDYVAQKYLGWRSNDGATGSVPYSTSDDPGRWRPDPLNPDQVAWGPEWGSLHPFTIEHSGQFSMPGVPDLNSQAYTDAFNEVKSLGAIDSTTRTADQTDMAIFWAYDRATMGPPPVMFNRSLHSVASQTGNTQEENARLFALASVAMADAATAAWDGKFADDFWRPITGIREADEDGNPDTVADPNWTPLGAPGPDPNSSEDDFTPPFPAYPSGHATMGGALFETLRIFYGTDDISFDLTSEETIPSGISTRSFSSFSEAEWENAMSRLYMGVHWSFDSTDGIALGNDIAQYVYQNFAARVVPEPGTLMLAMFATAMAVGQRRLLRRPQGAGA